MKNLVLSILLINGINYAYEINSAGDMKMCSVNKNNNPFIVKPSLQEGGYIARYYSLYCINNILHFMIRSHMLFGETSDAFVPIKDWIDINDPSKGVGFIKCECGK